MKIGVDAGALSITDDRLKVGVWRVTYNLIKELSRIDTQNIYILYGFRPIEQGIRKELTKNMIERILPQKGWSSIWLPLELKKNPVDVFLGLAQSVPSSTSYNIGFIYDLAFLYTPDAYGNSFEKLKKQTDMLVKHSDHIVTISNASKNDIISHYDISEKKISVCYPGVDSHFSSEGKNYKSENPYFLFVGSLNKAKDLPLAIESFAVFLKKINKPYDFLLIGGDYWPDHQIDQTIKQYGLSERVKKLGFIPDQKLPEYYRGATTFFTTALREGFCLPAVESMACDTPVISVDRGAMKEVIGDGGIIPSSIDPKDIADCLYSIAMNRELRLQLKNKAVAQAKKFSWEKFAECIYHKILTY